MKANGDAGEVDKGSSIRGQDGPLGSRGGGRNYEVVRTSRPALLPYGNQELGMGLGNVNVVVDHRDGGEDVVDVRLSPDLGVTS